MPELHLETERLLLRPQTADDIAGIVVLLNDYDIARNLANVPHPYTEADAQGFLGRWNAERASGAAYPFLVTRKPDHRPIGGCGLRRGERGVYELGYWLGKPYWGQGYASEAARRVAGFAFRELDVPVVKASYFHDNPASGRVLAKLGAVPAGVEHHDCLARGHAVYSHAVMLDRENFGRTSSGPVKLGMNR
jgi:RimJ/RimL family protein N-acetyltransferase